MLKQKFYILSLKNGKWNYRGSSIYQDRAIKTLAYWEDFVKEGFYDDVRMAAASTIYGARYQIMKEISNERR